MKYPYKLIDKSDIVLEVVDGRFPSLSRVSSIESYLIEKKIPFILVLNKVDLIPRDLMEDHKKHFSKKQINHGSGLVNLIFKCINGVIQKMRRYY